MVIQSQDFYNEYFDDVTSSKSKELLNYTVIPQFVHAL